MINDYRNTKYCPKLANLGKKKKNVEKAVKNNHKRAVDMHCYISDNAKRYKRLFAGAYNNKCAYCGVSLDVLGLTEFEIDHIIPKSSARFKTKADAGYMDNLTLACYNCNRKKDDFDIGDQDRYKVNPDGVDICNSFTRNEDYYIKISESCLNDPSVHAFYDKIGFGEQVHRLDYLLINMIGLREYLKGQSTMYMKLNQAIELIRKKRG